jgi:hypothetical protein
VVQLKERNNHPARQLKSEQLFEQLNMTSGITQDY